MRTLPQTQDQFTIRGDQDLGKFGRSFVRVTKTMYDNMTDSNLQEIGDRVFVQDTTNWQVNHTLAWRANLVNQFRIGRVTARADQKGIPCPQSDVDSLQLTGVFTNIPDDQRECPQVGIQGYSGVGGAVNAYSASNQPMWDISNTTTWIRGNHQLNFGLNLSLLAAAARPGDRVSSVAGIASISASPAAPWPTSCSATMATCGLFQPGAFSVPGQAGNPREFNFKYIAPYIQDDWKVTPSLTLNLGLRWDYRSVPYETRNRMAWRNLDYAPGGLLVADETLVAGGITDGAYYQYAGRRSPENPDRYKVFAPRAGFAWRPFTDEKTVVRGGYGLFFDSAEGREIDGAVGRVSVREPRQLSAVARTTGAAPDHRCPVSKLRDPRRRDACRQHVPGGEPEPPAEESVRAAVVARRAAPVDRRDGLRGELRRQQGHQPADAAEHRAVAPLRSGKPLSVEERRPYPNFVVYIDSNWGGRSNYNALNTKLEHRGRSSLLTFAYTWAKSTDTKSAAAGIGATGFNGWQGFLDNQGSRARSRPL